MTTPTDANSAGNASGTAETGAAAAQVSNSVAATAGAGADLESLIRDFDKSTASNAALNSLGKMVKAIHDEHKPTNDWVRFKAQEEIAAKEKADIQNEIAFYKKEIPALEKVPDAVIEAHLHLYGAHNQSGVEAWSKRGEAPDWETQHRPKVKALISENLGQIAPTTEVVRVTNDVERAQAAIRNVSTDPPKAPNLSPLQKFNMNERDWENYKRETWAQS